MAAIDLSDVLAGLAAAQVTTSVLDGKDVSDTDSTRSNRQEVAVISRDLLHLADRLQALSSVVRSEYWTIKGQEPLL